MLNEKCKLRARTKQPIFPKRTITTGTFMSNRLLELLTEAPKNIKQTIKNQYDILCSHRSRPSLACNQQKSAFIMQFYIQLLHFHCFGRELFKA